MTTNSRRNANASQEPHPLTEQLNKIRFAFGNSIPAGWPTKVDASRAIMDATRKLCAVAAAHHHPGSPPSDILVALETLTFLIHAIGLEQTLLILGHSASIAGSAKNSEITYAMVTQGLPPTFKEGDDLPPAVVVVANQANMTMAHIVQFLTDANRTGHTEIIDGAKSTRAQQN